jgi:hypothetical protein
MMRQCRRYNRQTDGATGKCDAYSVSVGFSVQNYKQLEHAQAGTAVFFKIIGRSNPNELIYKVSLQIVFLSSDIFINL